MRLLTAFEHWTAAAGLLGCLTGCFPGSPDFPDARSVRGVRVLGATSEPASGLPGGELALALEVFDGAPLLEQLQRAAAPEGEPEAEAAPVVPLSVAWLSGCHNPPGDIPSGCYASLQQIAAQLPDPLPESAEDVSPEQAAFFGLGARFLLRIPEQILEGRQLRTSAAPFGVSFSFFGVCRGVLRPALDAGAAVPLSCHDRETGERLGSEAFVAGFVTTYTYAGAVNQAPALLGASFDGVELPSVDCESDADCEGLAAGELAFSCERPLAPAFSPGVGAPARRCLPLLPPCSQPPCPSHELLPRLAAESVERDPAAAAPGGRAPEEILWVKYFGFGGFSRSEALINDRATGLNPDYALRWSAPPLSLASPLPVWAIVQDNRGGTSVARWDLVVRE